MGNTNVADKRKKTTRAKLSMKSEVCEGKVILTLPLQTKSEANCFEHWTKKHQRHKNQQRLVALALRPLRDKIKLPCNILFTRLAPNKLDKHDNLPMSFKYIVDACCAIITGNYKAGKADSDERISIAYLTKLKAKFTEFKSKSLFRRHKQNYLVQEHCNQII